MKKLSNYLFLLLAFTSLVSCDLINGEPDEELTEQQVIAETLVGTWSVSSINVQGNNVLDVFGNFSVTFTADEALTSGSISVSGDAVPNTDAKLIGTSSASNWTFDGSSLTALVVNNIDGNASNFTATLNGDTELTLTFSYVAPTARLQGLVGDYVVVLTK
ncbi:hypothetical protein QWY31_03580 [Cytophagales bacterium LB-30]|uniref:Lipocalin-like domain-containing protein n=1 Tax=Shiella aurantiaca TaxID=3058365 RepID=A0ABT8F290_9BACT|nr:hypothetical protein [Shiella aurantiaca]MDN4164566.1 hypothetical protein [Shiella aurantiaca]